ncbi:von Willebrand factor type A domain-containing protein [Streptomyces oryzae]|uniref:von Willebrand factor type A domain-containing protein n=1 Tax=Streptomyces oryzae TaxID=1434886 RepID=A0ABS3XKF9_9ACTN|nr:von Willebrand factor type A domain-containing protein [Streptomyces oryzae]MBO8195884.1 von Willebrand factor type A domain-containing protein [Streptomyces oryzae]
MKRGLAATAAIAVAATVLAGCTGGSTGNAETADSAKGSAPGAPGHAEGAPAPGEVAPTKPTEPKDFKSTFALDVDTASYSYAQRTLRDGARPAPQTVRTEEFVNSFPQGYQRPKGDGFSVSADGARTGAAGWSLMRVGLATRKTDPDAPRRPAALTFVLDVSGSMAEPGRLDLVKDALRTAAGQLRGSDSVSLVTFSGEATTVMPMTRLDDGGRGRLRAAVAKLEPQSSTNLGAGMKQGYQQAAEHRRSGATNRVVLMSDALANTGETDAKAILGEVARHRKEQGISLFGVGVGSDYGDDLMERLTNKGDGSTVYISTRGEARDVFVNQLPRNIELRARDAKAQVVFDRDAVDDFRLLGYENRKVADEDFRNDTVDGGEVGPGHTVTALYAVRLKHGATGRAATATVRWQDPDSRKPHEKSHEVATTALTADSLWKGADVSPYLRLSAVAAYFADALRRGEGSASPGPEPQPAEPTAEPLPAAPSLGKLRSEADRLAEEPGLRSAAGLAKNISRAQGAP